MTNTTVEPTQSTAEKRRGLAITSFILAIASIPVVLGPISGIPLLGIPALIMGIIAAKRAKRDSNRYAGRGLALTGIVLGCLSLLVSGVLGAVQRPRIHRKVCGFHLFSIARALNTWSTNHGGLLPFEVSYTDGGTKEECQPNAEGWDSSTYLHFRVLSNELAVTALVCPSDSSKLRAQSIADLQAANVTYELQTGTDSNTVGPEQRLLGRCPIHGTMLHLHKQRGALLSKGHLE